LANKIGVLNGIILFILSLFAGIPLGIYFSMGINSYTNLPLNLLEYDGVKVYLWGIIDGTLTGKGWLELGLSGRTSFLLIQLPVLVACAITFIASFVENNKGRKGLMVGILLIVISIAIFITDAIVSGVHLEISGPIPYNQLISSLGLGFWVLVISLGIEIVAMKIHSNAIVE